MVLKKRVKIFFHHSKYEQGDLLLFVIVLYLKKENIFLKKILSSSGPGPGQVKVRLRSGEGQEGQSQVRSKAEIK